MNAPLTKAELMAVLLAPARRHPERSRAMPAAAYRDPAEAARFASEEAGEAPRAKKPQKPGKKGRLRQRFGP